MCLSVNGRLSDFKSHIITFSVRIGHDTSVNVNSVNDIHISQQDNPYFSVLFIVADAIHNIVIIDVDGCCCRIFLLLSNVCIQ